MSIEHKFAPKWRRKHDPENQFRGVNIHCSDEAADLICLCRNRPPTTRFKAAGSHWSLSESTLSDGESIETNWPDRNDTTSPRLSGFATDLRELINDHQFEFMVQHPPGRPSALLFDPCVGDGFRRCFFVHLKAGTRIYEAYSLLDRSPDVMTDLAFGLNQRLEGGPDQRAYDGPWAFETLGGAGGQTVFGALTTGTHGGDYRQKPISDGVMAVHLITDGGPHYWIEPASNGLEHQLTDDDKLHGHFDNLVPGVTFEIIRDDDIVSSGIVPVNGLGVAALGVGAGAAALALGAGLCPALALAAAVIKELADEDDPDDNLTIAEAMDKAVKVILALPIPNMLAVMILRVIFDTAFKMEQADRDFVAISYAVMDAHDYLDRSCYPNAESIEVFFDANRPDLYCAYVDEVLSFERYQQEHKGQFSVGYISLRYIRGSSALISPSRFPETVAIEISVLRAASGSISFVKNAANIARKALFNAAFHWGQNNPLDAGEVQRLYGQRLDRWRAALFRLTHDGSRDGFSNAFTRRTGLELI